MTVQSFRLQITDDEYRARCEQLLEHIQALGCNGVVLFNNDYILYYTGFAFIPTERPIGFVMNTRGERGLFVPRLEVEHAEAYALIDRVAHYPEYPGETHPMNIMAETLNSMGVIGKIGIDHDGYPPVLGYKPLPLSIVAQVKPQSVRAFIEVQMMVKSAAEVELLKESVRWANLAHMLLQRYTRPGLTETDVTQRASDEATRAMLDAIGPIYRAQNMTYNGAFAGYRGQIGRNAAIPHALANNITFQAGDVLVTGASAPVWGYVSELERTMIIGRPSSQQERFFNYMVALQDIAFEAIRPGIPCSEVDKAVRKAYQKYDLQPYWKHHTGHCIGLRYHEGPFLDTGDDTEIQPGMVFTVEPGLYIPEIGGFRHSDTVVVTDDGIEILTYYPRDLDSLILPLD